MLTAMNTSHFQMNVHTNKTHNTTQLFKQSLENDVTLKRKKDSDGDLYILSQKKQQHES